MHVAAQHDLAAIIDLILEAGGDPNVRNGKGHPPCDLCKKDGTKQLLFNAMKTFSCIEQEKHCGDQYDDFAHLTFACVRADTAEIVRLIEKHPYLLSTQSVYGDTILHLACETGNLKAAKLLLNLKADPCITNARGKTALEEAKASGFTDFSERLEEQPSSQFSDESESRLAYTQLQYACARNDVSAVREILGNQADIAAVNAVNVYGDCALHYAARSGSVVIVNLLISAKAALNVATCASGDTPVYLAIRRGNREIVDSLIAAGASLETVNKKGLCGHDLLRDMGMVEHGDGVENSSFTPLMYACVRGDFIKVKTLVESSTVSVNEVNVYGDSALSYACLGKSVELVEFLIEAKSDLNHANTFGETPLHLAVTNSHRSVAVDIVRVLVSRGADKSRRNHKNKTPHDICKHDDIIILL